MSFAAAFETLAQQRAQALLGMTDVLFNSRRDELATLAARQSPWSTSCEKPSQPGA